MSRARQVANFDPALLAADEVSGDKVHGGTISGSPTLVTPNLGTPASGVATNLTGIPAANITGVLPVGVTGGSGLTALGTVTSANLSNTAIDFPAGHLLKVQTFNLASDIAIVTSTAWLEVFAVTYSPHGGSANNSTMYPTVCLSGQVMNVTGQVANKFANFQITGDDVTNIDIDPSAAFWGGQDYGTSGILFSQKFNFSMPSATLDGTGNADVTFTFQIRNQAASGAIATDIYGNNTDQETHLVIREVQ